MVEPNPIIEKTYRAIGRFIFEFSQLEYTVRHYLAEEIRLSEEYFSAVVESYDVGLLCTVTKEVFGKSRPKNNAAEIKKLINKLYDLNKHRNRVAHGLWVPFKEGGTVLYVPRNQLRSVSHVGQAEALEKLADEACELRRDLNGAFLASLDFNNS